VIAKRRRYAPDASRPSECPGDCNGDRAVLVAELISAVNIALGNTSVTTCPAADINRDGVVLVNELIAAVGHALAGC